MHKYANVHRLICVIAVLFTVLLSACTAKPAKNDSSDDTTPITSLVSSSNLTLSSTADSTNSSGSTEANGTESSSVVSQNVTAGHTATNSSGGGSNSQTQNSVNTDKSTVSTIKNKEDDSDMSRTSLQNTYTLLTQQKKLNVVYFGGSITQGSGASSIDKTSWRALTTQWLREQFPQAVVKESNSSIGASGSLLGSYRVERDVISQKPDLVFLEFAINDKYRGNTAAEVSVQYETIIRKILMSNPKCNIICLYTTDSNCDISVPYTVQAQAQEEIAKYYGLPSTNMGYRLRTELKLDNTYEGTELSSAWKNYFTDIVHPNDKGHAIYAKIVQEYLKKELVDNKPVAELKSCPFPKAKNSDLCLTLKCIQASEDHLKNAKNWFSNNDIVCNNRAVPYPTTLYTNNPDNELTYTFTGTSFGILGTFSGIVEYSIDGGDWVFNSISGDHPLFVTKGLPRKAHTVKIRASNASAGKPMKIAAFLVGLT